MTVLYALTDYDYHLPPELIAQTAATRRNRSRLMVMSRRHGTVSHHHFDHIAERLTPADVLVVNNTRVMPARLLGRKASGGRVEVLILDPAGLPNKPPNGISAPCRCLIKASKRPRPGTRLQFYDDLAAEVVEAPDPVGRVRFFYNGNFGQILDRIGRMPLPPYIKRERNHDDPRDDLEDRRRYQTVYASQSGAIAAPTAGLHFTENLLARIRQKGTTVAAITLHVGFGTFSPVRVTDIRDHQIHSESFTISPAAAETINSARKRGGRLIAVGTTSIRTLEYATDEKGLIRAGSGDCNLYIYPGYRFKAIDGLITNFHLPQSTLIMLVAAFVGRRAILDAYRTAIENRYRFFSYGDAMFITE